MLSCDSLPGHSLPMACCSDVVIKMNSQPQQVSSRDDGYVAVACINEILILQNGQLLCKETVKYEPSSISLHPSQLEVAVGGAKVSVSSIYGYIVHIWIYCPYMENCRL